MSHKRTSNSVFIVFGHSSKRLSLNRDRSNRKPKVRINLEYRNTFERRPRRIPWTTNMPMIPMDQRHSVRNHRSWITTMKMIRKRSNRSINHWHYNCSIWCIRCTLEPHRSTNRQPKDNPIKWHPVYCGTNVGVRFFKVSSHWLSNSSSSIHLCAGIARLCCDPRRPVRSSALGYLQRSVLLPELHILSPTEWESVFNKVLFPLLLKLLETTHITDHHHGIEETRVRVSQLLCRIFLQHLSPLLTLPTFTALWLTILDFMDRYLKSDQTDMLVRLTEQTSMNDDYAFFDPSLAWIRSGIVEEHVARDEYNRSLREWPGLGDDHQRSNSQFSSGTLGRSLHNVDTTDHQYWRKDSFYTLRELRREIRDDSSRLQWNLHLRMKKKFRRMNGLLLVKRQGWILSNPHRALQRLGSDSRHIYFSPSLFHRSSNGLLSFSFVPSLLSLVYSYMLCSINRLTTTAIIFCFSDCHTMATSNVGKTCEVNGKTCKKTIQARCYHCDKDLCRVHLLEHVQLVEVKTGDELNSLVDQFNQVSARFASMSISPRILEEPFARLEQWREDAHKQIDQAAETKRQELTRTIKRYQRTFAMRKEQEMKKLHSNKEQLAMMLAESDATREQIADLQSSVNQAMNYLASLDKHRIDIVPTSLDYSVNILSKSGKDRSAFGGDLREFQITYVRLNGSIHSYNVSANASENITHLKNCFADEYSVLNESNQMMQRTNDYLIHRPQTDYILPVEVYNHRIHLQYQDDHSLNDILIRDKIIFYEMSYSLMQENSPRIMMPCSFHHSMRNEPIGLPIYLDLPRHKCKGQDIRDAMHGALDRFLQIDSKDPHHLFDVTVKYEVNNNVTTRKLHEVLSDQMDFTNVHTSVRVGVTTQMVEAYQKTRGSSTQILYNLLNWN